MTTPLQIWLEKKDLLEKQRAISADASQKFALRKEIEECETEIARLRKEQLIADSVVACNQLGSASSAVDKLLQEQIKTIEKKLHINNPSDRDLQKRLPKIDFKKAAEIINNFINQDIEDANAAFFLIQNTRDRAGEECIARIKNILEEDTTNLESFPIRSSAIKANKKDLLNRLGEYFGVKQDSNDLVSYAQAIIENICQHAKGAGDGAIIFIELHDWDYLENKEEVLPWFLTNFWQPLLQQSLIKLKDQIKTRFVTIVTSKDDILTPCPSLNDYCIKDWNYFDKHKVFELVLQQHWTQKEIADWLAKHSGYNDEQNSTSTIAEKIHRVTKGIPTEVCK
ncbi:MAG: hypothetical protein FD167_4703, partial [bacterium]